MPPNLDQLAEAQAGAVSRSQALTSGLSGSAIAHRCSSGRWQPLYPGVYASYSGPLVPQTRAWAALLHAGAGSVLSHRSAAFEQRLLDIAPDLAEVTVRATHRVTPQPGIVLHRTRHLEARRHPARRPPQTRVEDTVLDLVEAAQDEDEVIGWLTRGVQRRLTTPDRLSAAAVARGRLRHRRLVGAVLAEVVDGIASPLELRYARDVERRHGLPRGRRGLADRQRGRRVYRDVAYEEFTTYVELDGVLYHRDQQLRDDERDNELVVRGAASLRYGWAQVNGRPCLVAGQVGAVLQCRGWTGRILRCGPRCSAA
ncbi:type IV toxin-antitoxin system AbiEi family antitoxin domain-containing protein [Angustibacter luteus]|uniref:Type IV toxin-antitoxin system AbiEi family antitoxin domain-containing protein n=1 Tax=Angustibacter luteus TaxID=658456 RepID=A0ABW1JAN0_9ACTN